VGKRLGVIVAAGSGIRLGRGEPKALVSIGGRPLLARALEPFAPSLFDRVVVAAPPERLEEFRRVAADRAAVVEGGRTRSESVRRGFEALGASGDDVVAVHDAARPFVTPDEIRAILAAADRSGAAIAAVPVADTIKEASDRRIVRTIDRSRLWAAATPQAFRAAILSRALASGRDATDEACLCEDLGIPVELVAVSRLSFKITTPEDLELAEALVRARKSAEAEGGSHG
jgi:2-C-methyl-D-erythritol 4-phosphate cytidylyltransferase